MRKAILASISAAVLLLPQAASALPRTEAAFQTQFAICRQATQLILDGATDDEENDFLIRRLEEEGWTESGDLEELMLLCVFFKQGYLFAGE